MSTGEQQQEFETAPNANPFCTGPIRLPDHMQEQAAELAIRENAQNRPILNKLVNVGGLILKKYIESQGGIGGILTSILAKQGDVMRQQGFLTPATPVSAIDYTPEIDEQALAEAVLQPEHLAVLATRYWRQGFVKLSVGFVEQTSLELANKIIACANLWGKSANVEFALSNSPGSAQVRISRGNQFGGGYWSYLGTDILSIPANKPTMTLEGFSLRTPDSEYLRVVCHEFGHTLGFPHEHMRAGIISKLDRNKTIQYFQQTQGWSASEVVAQVLTPIKASELLGTSSAEDVQSIMAYQLPGSITVDGQPIPGGSQINETDYSVAAKTYPKASQPPVNPPVVNPPVNPGVQEGAGILVLNGVQYQLKASRA